MRTGGRKRGTPNKRTQAVIDRLDQLNCDPLEGMVTIAKQAMQERDLALAGRMYSELAQYVHPKRKAIEVQDHLTYMPERGIRIVGVTEENKSD